MHYLVIQTQCTENYNWDSNNREDAYWKFKGGEVYLAEIEDPRDAPELIRRFNLHVCKYGIGVMEYVTSSKIVPAVAFNAADHLESWEDPVWFRSESEASVKCWQRRTWGGEEPDAPLEFWTMASGDSFHRRQEPQEAAA